MELGLESCVTPQRWGKTRVSVTYSFSCMLNAADTTMCPTNLFTVERDYKSEGITNCKTSRQLSAWFFKLLFSPKLQKDLKVKASSSSWFPSMSEHLYLMITLQSITSVVLSNTYRKDSYCCFLTAEVEVELRNYSH